MPRMLIAAITLAALLLPVGGCYRYDAKAKNLTGHDVRISLHKGSRKREVSTAVLASGASAAWTGSFNGPVVLRVESAGELVDVELPRRAHTVVEVSHSAGDLAVVKTIGDESWTFRTYEAEEAAESENDSTPADETAPDAETDGEMIDLIEPEDG